MRNTPGSSVLEKFNVTIEAVHQLPIPAGEVAAAVVYAFGYATLVLAIGSYLFSRRDFR